MESYYHATFLKQELCSCLAALPLIFVKPFEQKRGGDDALIEEDGDSDFEEIHAPVCQSQNITLKK